MVHVTGPGTSVMRWTVTNGPCSPTDTVMITFHLPEELTVLDAGPDQEQNNDQAHPWWQRTGGVRDRTRRVIGGRHDACDPADHFSSRFRIVNAERDVCRCVRRRTRTQYATLNVVEFEFGV